MTKTDVIKIEIMAEDMRRVQFCWRGAQLRRKAAAAFAVVAPHWSAVGQSVVIGEGADPYAAWSNANFNV